MLSIFARRCARIRGPRGISAAERKAILEIEKYDKIRHKAKTYLKDWQERWRRAGVGAAIAGAGATTAGTMARQQVSVISLEHAAKYKGQRIGEGHLKGQCATGV